jgi:hypothetical protein
MPADQGRQVTGRGQVVIEEAMASGATCQKSSGAGRAVFTVPTAEGLVEPQTGSPPPVPRSYM